MKLFIPRLRAWLNHIPIQDPVERRMASLLQVVLLGLMVVVVLATIALVSIPALSVQEKLNAIISDLFGFLVVALPLGLLRRGYFRGSLVIIITILLVTPTLAVTVVFNLLDSGGILFQFTLAIILAGLLIGRRALAFTFVLSAVVVGFGAFRGQSAAPQLAIANLQVAVNFILWNGLMGLFLDRFGHTLRAALNAALERESELQMEVSNRQQAEESLRGSEERYRKLINSARDVIFTISNDGIITSLNPAFEIFTGWSRAEWLGRSFDELVAEGDRTRAHNQFERILHSETVRALRLRLHTRAGEMLVVEMNISPQLKDDQVVGLLGIARDMTQEQHAEDALKASEKRFRALIESGWDAFTLADAQGTILYASPSTKRVLGYTAEEFVGVNAFTLFHPDDMALAREKLLEVTQAPGNVVVAQIRTRHKDGSWRWLEGVVTNLFAEPDVQALVTNYRDITERKQAEAALRESEARYHHILDTMMEGCQIIDFDWRYLYVNEVVATQQARLKPEGMLNHTVMELYPGVENTELFAVLRRCMEGRVHAHLETPFSFPDGRLGWFELSIQPAREGIFILSTDITVRKQAKDALRESEERFRSIFQTAAVSIWEEDYSEVRAALDELRAQGVVDFRRHLAEHPGFAQRAVQMVKVLDVNEATIKLYGAKDKTELLGSLEKFVEPHNLHEELIAFAEGKTYFEKETSDRRLDGSLIHLWMTITFFTDAAGLHKALVCLSDITPRKQAEKRLQQQNQRLKALREIDTAILAADSVENIVGAALSHIRDLIDCRRANVTLIDRGTNELVIFEVSTAVETSIPAGRRLPLSLFHDIIQTLSQNQPILLSDLKALSDPSPGIQSLLKDGLRSTCSLPLFSQGNLIGMFSMHSEFPGFFEEQKISLGREVANQVAIAITQNRLVGTLHRLNTDLERRVRERENLIAELTTKNAELERFTYTVSHDLKSPLVTMKGFLGYLEQDITTGNVERLKIDTQRIANAVEKMQELLNDLLELSRIGRFVNSPENVLFEELARDAIELVDGQIREHHVTVTLQPDLPVVYGDKLRLLEVLQNLLENAIKYMGAQPQPQVSIGWRGEEDGRHVFYVKDNGIGIAPEYRELIFGLFNKLDARSEGTGIGLTLVKRIVEYHGGTIWVESELAAGSTFFFTLPSRPAA